MCIVFFLSSQLVKTRMIDKTRYGPGRTAQRWRGDLTDSRSIAQVPAEWTARREISVCTLLTCVKRRRKQVLFSMQVVPIYMRVVLQLEKSL